MIYPARDSGQTPPTTRQRSTFFGILASLAVILGDAELLRVRLLPPLERTSADT